MRFDLEATFGRANFPHAELVAAGQYAGRTAHGLARQKPAPGYLQMQWSSWGASGLAGVWAEENTRASIFDGCGERKPSQQAARLKVRLFGGYGFNDKMLNDPQMVRKAHARGVSMGGDMKARLGRAPDFLLWATQDPARPLQRLQMVKGWIDAEGKTHEKVLTPHAPEMYRLMQQHIAAPLIMPELI